MQLRINSLCLDIDENVSKVGAAVLSGDFFGRMINRRAERASHISSLLSDRPPFSKGGLEGGSHC